MKAQDDMAKGSNPSEEEDIFASADTDEEIGDDQSGSVQAADDEDLSDAAEAAVKEVAEQRQPYEKAAQTEQPSETPPTDEGAAPAPAQAGVKDPEQHAAGLLRGMLDERERARAAAAERDALKARLEAIERERQAPPDPNLMFADPEAYRKAERDFVAQETRKLAEQQENVLTELALQAAAARHGNEQFSGAWNAFCEAVSQNPGLKQEWDKLPIPQRGDAVVNWHRQQTVMREVGADPVAYREKLKAELLAELQAGSQPAARSQSRPQNVTRLPPSLNRATTAATDADDDNDDSEEAIWEAGRTSSRRR